jgi:glycine oxidase ThiO
MARMKTKCVVWVSNAIVAALAFQPSYRHLPRRPAQHLRLATSGSSDDDFSQENSETGISLSLRNTGTNEYTNPVKQRMSYPSSKRRRKQHRDIVIVGGGLAGLSAALYVSQIDPTRHVTILDKQDPESHRSKDSTVASYAAAGMLAPNSERLPKGDLLNLCLESRNMYGDFCDMVESLAQESGEEGMKYLATSSQSADGLEPWSIGYVASGGFLAPAFAGDSVATWAPPDDGGAATWLDATQARELEPNLHPDVVGAYWFPEDASVDARRLTNSLRAACVAAGVQILHGPSNEITSLDLSEGICKGVRLQSGRYLSCNSILVANGAWMRNLLPVPVEPHKGQSLSLRMPKDRPPILKRVLFAQDSYIVPKADGRIVVGATVEAGSYDPNVTPGGLLHILTHALQLVPALKDLPIEETWAGLRPTTPDKGPILGKTPWENLYLAGGYWRNGVLLAPKTGELLAALMTGQEIDEQDQAMLDAFAWDRFTSKDGGDRLSANARYAASMHPIHSRKSGAGVAASVGTELGTYSSARSAKEERQQDRNSLWNENGDGDVAFERAATMGRNDGAAYSFGDDESPYERKSVSQSTAQTTPSFEDPKSSKRSLKASDTVDAYTVGASDEIQDSHSAETKASDLTDMYEKIRANKAKKTTTLGESDGDEEVRPDPGFRIFYKDPETGERHEVPPYTSPGVFQQKLHARKKSEQSANGTRNDVPISDVVAPSPAANGNKEAQQYSETTYDGYQEIQSANSRQTRAEELEAMRMARQSNRVGQESIKESDIGAQPMGDE